MKYEEFIEKLELLNKRGVEIELEKCFLADQFIMELPFHKGDHVSDDNKNVYEVTNVEFDYVNKYFFVNARVVEENGYPCPQDPDRWEWRKGVMICGEDVLKLKKVKLPS